MGRPLTVILDLTERCNLRCVMCYFSEVDRIQFPPYETKLSDDGNMPIPVFERIAADLFPRARRVALGCAAEPMLHPKFREILAIAGRYGVPDLWYPTNLLALTEKTAEALVDHRVTTVAASIDGVTSETYEKIRVGARWDKLIEKLDLLRSVKARRRSRLPRLRIIFTWMRSNREELPRLPEFAKRHGAVELDVRYVAPTEGVDVTPELLEREDPASLRSELASTARHAVELGLRLYAFPEFETAADRSHSILARAQRRLWRMRAGLETLEGWRHYRRQQQKGCAYPDTTIVVRPNGAVSPCVFWKATPIGFYPSDDLAGITAGAPLTAIREGLACGSPIGSCTDCEQRRDAFYRPDHSPASAVFPNTTS